MIKRRTKLGAPLLSGISAKRLGRRAGNANRLVTNVTELRPNARCTLPLSPWLFFGLDSAFFRLTSTTFLLDLRVNDAVGSFVIIRLGPGAIAPGPFRFLGR